MCLVVLRFNSMLKLNRCVVNQKVEKDYQEPKPRSTLSFTTEEIDQIVRNFI